MTDTDVPSTELVEEPRSRRQLLKLAGAAVAGGAAMSVVTATPASAATNDPLLMGGLGNTADVVTFLNYDGTADNAALVIENTGANAGPDLKLAGTGRFAQAPALSGNAKPSFNVIQTELASGVAAHEVVRTTAGVIWASTGAGYGGSTQWKRMNTVRTDIATGTGAAFAPFRFLDTRSGAKLNSGTAYNYNVAAAATIPDDAVAIFGNLTVVAPTFSGYVKLYPRGVAEPTVSSINFSPNQTIANFFCLGLGTGGNAGQITVKPGQLGGQLHVLIDITAYVQ